MDVSGLVRVAAHDLHHGLGILTQFPFDASATSVREEIRGTMFRETVQGFPAS